MATPGAKTAASSVVRKIYRDFYHIYKHTRDETHLRELRTRFREPLLPSAEPTSALEDRLKQAESRLSFVRMTVNVKPRKSGSGEEQPTRYVYRDGERLTGTDTTLRDSAGRVVSNWNGSNMDPESVTKHNKLLRRAGFVNNAHAKGIF